MRPRKLRPEHDLPRAPRLGPGARLAQVLAAQPGRKVYEAVAQVALAPAERGRIRAHDQRRASGRLRAFHDVRRKLEVRLDVELKPGRGASGAAARAAAATS